MSRETAKLPSVSVLVISFNHKAILENLLPQLLSEEYPEEKYEVLIVDGGSTDGSREWLASIRNPKFRVVLQNENRGRSSSRNDGIKEAHGDVVIMLDGDHTIEKGFVLAHAKRHMERECVVVGQSQFSNHWRFRSMIRYLNTRGAKKLPLGQSLPGRYFLTRNCSMPKSVFERVGYFSEAFTEWGGEDLELGVRFEEAGIEIVYEPNARAWHHHHRPLNALLKNLEVYGEKAIPYLVKDHPQLYQELNLHQLEKTWMRFLMTGFVYNPLKALATLFMPFYVPNIIFDYFHLRQYGRGFLNSKKPEGRNH